LGLEADASHRIVPIRTPVIDDDAHCPHICFMKVAKKSPAKRLAATRKRATLTLNAATYERIEGLRGSESRSAWVQRLVEKEEVRSDRESLIERLREQYTPEVCRETLELNEEYPVHES
jgi:hypothetical protein